MMKLLSTLLQWLRDPLPTEPFSNEALRPGWYCVEVGLDSHSPMGTEFDVDLTDDLCKRLNRDGENGDRHGSEWRKFLNERFPQYCWPVAFVRWKRIKRPNASNQGQL
jgi:hypothetical protein